MSREALPGVVFKRVLQPKKPYLLMWKQGLQTGLQKYGSRCSSLISQNKIEIFGYSRKQFSCWRAGGVLQWLLQAAVKHDGGSLQVWGWISANNVEDWVRINCVISAEKYSQILIHYAAPSGRHLIWTRRIRQLDNDPETHYQRH